MKVLMTFTLALLLSSCASSERPPQQRGPYGGSVHYQMSDTDTAQPGQEVRWGGKIIQVNNYEDHSLLHIVEFPLNPYGLPLLTADSGGRFLARSDTFLDPEIYTVGSLVTVNGEVVEHTAVTVDKKQLKAPVVALRDTQRWPFNKASGRPYNPKHDWPFMGYGYYGTGSYSP